MDTLNLVFEEQKHMPFDTFFKLLINLTHIETTNITVFIDRKPIIIMMWLMIGSNIFTLTFLIVFVLFEIFREKF